MGYYPPGFENICDIPDPDSLEGLANKYNITCDGVDEDGELQFMGHRDDLRQFFEEREELGI